MIRRFEQFSYYISSIYRSILRIERMEMAKYGLKGSHAQCLLALRRYPEGISAARLCEICDKDKASISRTIRELEMQELVRRPDTRGKHYRAPVMLTEKGNRVATDVSDIAYQAVKQAAAGYDMEQREVFIQVLELIAENLGMICRNGLAEESDIGDIIL